MSLASGVLENQMTSGTGPPRRTSVWWRTSTRLPAMLRSFHEAYTSGRNPRRTCAWSRYTDLLQNLEPTMKRILDFISEIERPRPSSRRSGSRARSSATTRAATSIRPRSSTSTPERIRHGLGFVYDTFELTEQPG